MKKKKTVKFIALLALCLAAFAAAISVMFAWMTNIRYIHSAEFQIKQIESTIDMYIGIDENYNGVPDLLSSHDETDNYYLYKEATSDEDEDDWRAYSSYYTEKYAFKFWDSKYMLSVTDSASTFETYTIKEVEPSRIYTFKFAVTKYSAGEATLNFGFDKFDTDTSDTAAQFECRLYTVDTYGSLTSPTAWTALSKNGTPLIGTAVGDDGNSITATADGIELEYKSGVQQDVWLQIRLESSITEADIAQGASVTLPRFIATLALNTDSTDGTTDDTDSTTDDT